MRVSKELYQKVPGTVVVDLSWLMYRNHFALRNLYIMSPEGLPVPTGHVHQTLMDIGQLALVSPRVILAVDSPSDRFKIYPEYKANRHKDPNEFNIKVHTNLILAAATLSRNVFFMKRKGYEADDLINHITANGDFPTIFGSDNDLFQVPLPFKVANHIYNGIIQYEHVPTYLKGKYKIEGEWLPIWYKTVRGDPSDNLHPAAPRYNSKKLIQLCSDLKNEREWRVFWDYVTEKKDEKLLAAEDALKLNYSIVKPQPIYYEDPPLELHRITDYPVCQELTNLQCRAVLDFFSSVLGVTCE